MTDLEKAQEILAENVRLIRHGRGVSQEEFADLVGVSKVSVATVEARKGNPRLETLVKFASAAGVAPSELLIPHGDDWSV
ncbi:MAG: helix-turn-helix transcriptional regulator [Rhodobacteraceae bacterium]|nr:helix-turn-helix transcriptional regulator [Paracoccaceae bacterium]